MKKPVARCTDRRHVDLVAHPDSSEGGRMTDRQPNTLAAVLDDIEEFLEDQQDVRDGSDGVQLPNKAMSLLAELQAARRSETGTEEFRRVLTNISNWRKLCLDYDKDMGNDPRTFCEDVELIEQTAQIALKNAAPQAEVPMDCSTSVKAPAAAAPHRPYLQECLDAIDKHSAPTPNTTHTVKWQSPEDADVLLHDDEDETGAVDGCIVKLDTTHEKHDGGPYLRQAWFDGARNCFVCSATANTLYNVKAWVYDAEDSADQRNAP